MRQDPAGEADGDAFHALREQQRELHRERDGLLVSTIVAGCPLGDLRAEKDVLGELRQARFDVSGGRRVVAGEDVAPVPLGVDEQLLLAQLHHGVADRGIAVRMVLHAVADDVGDLVVATVVLLPQRVHDAALHRLEAVIDVRHGTFQDHVAGVVEEPVAVERVDVLRLRCGVRGEERRVGGGIFRGLGHGLRKRWKRGGV